jgi:hypothetical protein
VSISVDAADRSCIFTILVLLAPAVAPLILNLSVSALAITISTTSPPVVANATNVAPFILYNIVAFGVSSNLVLVRRSLPELPAGTVTVIVAVVTREVLAVVVPNKALSEIAFTIFAKAANISATFLFIMRSFHI